MAKAMRSPELRGVAGARLYSALISAATACGKPRRALELYQEMLESSSSGGGGGGGGGRGGEMLGAAAAQAALSPGGVEWNEDIVGEGNIDIAAGAGGGGSGGGGRRLPPPDAATFLAALDACAGLSGEESVSLAIGVTKNAAAAAREFQRGGGGGGTSGGTTTDNKAAAKARLSSQRLSEVLSKAGEVCAAAGKESTAQALAVKAAQLDGGDEVGGDSSDGIDGGR